MEGQAFCYLIIYEEVKGFSHNSGVTTKVPVSVYLLVGLDVAVPKLKIPLFVNGPLPPDSPYLPSRVSVIIRPRNVGDLQVITGMLVDTGEQLALPVFVGKKGDYRRPPSDIPAATATAIC